MCQTSLLLNSRIRCLYLLDHCRFEPHCSVESKPVSLPQMRRMKTSCSYFLPKSKISWLPHYQFLFQTYLSGEHFGFFRLFKYNLLIKNIFAFLVLIMTLHIMDKLWISYTQWPNYILLILDNWQLNYDILFYSDTFNLGLLIMYFCHY